MILQLLQDAFFAAVAAIGFAAISRPPHRAYGICALLAAIGHSGRYLLMADTFLGVHIIAATLLAAFAVGTLAVMLSPLAHIPAETCFFPALLPMIPGMYAYKAFAGLAMCVITSGQEQFVHYFYLFSQNALTCGCILVAMVVGATIPVFIFKKISFRATR